MHKKRVFVAINLPAAIKKKIAGAVEVLAPLFDLEKIQFVPIENWHITLSFLGEQNDEAVARIVEGIDEVLATTEPLLITLEKIAYGPPKNPRMIWLVGDAETSKHLEALKVRVEDVLVKRGVRFQVDNRMFNTHITLARFEKADSLPVIERKLPCEFYAHSVELMESELRRNGPVYTIVSKHELEG